MYSNKQVVSIAEKVAAAVPYGDIESNIPNIVIARTLKAGEGRVAISYDKNTGIYTIALAQNLKPRIERRLVAESLGHLVLHTACLLADVEESADFEGLNCAIKGRKGVEATLFANEYLSKT